ncbi:MAG: asparagine synthase-related protein [bacterium]
MKRIDKNFCMSSYLTLRYVEDMNVLFKEKMERIDVRSIPYMGDKYPCNTAKEIDAAIVMNFKQFEGKNIAILLSGGMDSANLASYMPKGSKAYTFQTKLDGVIDETAVAKQYADFYQLDHQIIDISWDGVNECLPICMKSKGAPVHSIEPQLYIAAMQAKKDNIDTIIIGESADLLFGGMDKLLSKDWTNAEWKERYTFVAPTKVLKNSVSMDYLFDRYKVEGTDKVNFLKFMDEIFSVESSSSYQNAFNTANIKFYDPYANLYMTDALDLNRVRNGEPKYLIRDLFSLKYPHIPVPNKIPMPRAVNQWLANWAGPIRDEFIPDCINGMTGDQKWLVYCLEQFLNIYEKW